MNQQSHPVTGVGAKFCENAEVGWEGFTEEVTSSCGWRDEWQKGSFPGRKKSRYKGMEVKLVYLVVCVSVCTSGMSMSVYNVCLCMHVYVCVYVCLCQCVYVYGGEWTWRGWQMDADNPAL